MRHPHELRTTGLQAAGTLPAAGALGLATLLAGLACLAWSLAPLAGDIANEQQYRALAARVTKGGDAATAGTDWSNPGLSQAAAWVQVGGTPIDYPVAQAMEQSPGFYLDHDLWGRASRAGCAYLDARSGPDEPHALVFAHHMGTTNAMFGPLSGAWRQEVFDGLGSCVWSTRETEGLSLEPLCALRQDQDFAKIQRFDFADADTLGAWLQDLVEMADAKAPDARERAGHASRVVTLVTCSSDVPGLSERTLVLFCPRGKTI